MGRVNRDHVHLYARGATLYGRIYARVHTHTRLTALCPGLRG